MSAWPLVRLADLGEIVTGATPRTNDDSFFGGNIPFVTPSELDQPLPVTTAPRSLSLAGLQSVRGIPKDAVMVCCIASLGKIGIAGCDLATNQQINSIIFNENKVFPRYGFYACRRLKPELVKAAPATTVPIISKSKFQNFEIPLPPMEEQKRIAAILDQADDIRRKRKHAIERLNQLGQAIFDEMFGEGGGYPSATLKSLGRVSTGSTPSTHREGNFVGPIPFITPGDLGSGKAVKRSLSEDAAKNSRTVGPNATLVCCIGTIGKMGKSYCYSAFNQQINAVEWGDKIDPDFGFYAVRKLRPILIHKGKGASTTLPILKKSEFEKFEIFTPPLDMQKKFAEQLGLIRIGRGSFAGSFDMLNALFASLQHRAFTGQL